MSADTDFDRLLTSVLEEQAGLRDPEYLREVFARTRRLRQRPAWSSPGRWLPMQLTMRRVVIPRAIPILIILGALILAVLIAAILIGSRPRLPAPFGLAAAGYLSFDSDGDIVVVAPDGNATRVLVAGVDSAMVTGATWSRDGTKVAYLSQARGASTVLLVADADGANARVVSGDLPMSIHRGPAATWSPDSRRLAFAANGNLYIVPADGSAPPLRLGDESVIRSAPLWSPGGTLIAFQGQRIGADPVISVISTDGHGETRLSKAGAAWPDWSPDGTRLVYGHGAEPVGDILVATFDGASWTETVLVGEEGDDVMPRWSNDGSQIAFLRCLGPGNPCLLHVVAAQVGARSRLLAGEDAGLGFALPCWSPDDRYVAVVGGAPGGAQSGQPGTKVVLIPVASGGSPISVPAPLISAPDACSWQRLAP